MKNVPQHRLFDITRDWKVGDETMPYRRTNGPTTILAFEGDEVLLEDGSRMHRKHLMTVPQKDVLEFILDSRIDGSKKPGDAHACPACMDPRDRARFWNRRNASGRAR